MTLHENAAGALVHVPYRQVFADDAARTGDGTVYNVGDLYKKAYQVDTNAEYVLTAVGPTTWTAVGGGGGGGGLLFTALKTTAYTTANGEHVLADPVSVGDFPVNSPSGPSLNDKFGVKKSVAGGIVTVTFNTTGGSTVDGGQGTQLVSAAFEDRIWQYNGTEWSQVEA